MKSFIKTIALVGAGAIFGTAIALAALYTYVELEEQEKQHFYFE